ncbi:MAG: acetolactate synthase small subunit [Firmicutes bacterium]|nr:acetolactate synthase small subunit [Bacillota bacterium]
MDNVKLYTLAVLVDNEAGVLSQVARLFSRKGYNIESLAVGPTNQQGVSRMTIQIYGDMSTIEFMCNQLRKLVPVHSACCLTDDSVRRKLVMIKVSTPTREIRNEIIQIANIFRANVIDVSLETLTVAVIGEESKVNSLRGLLEEYGILEQVQTGIIALERGKKTINDDTKEKGEFNYGKNVL